ncbi:hypothetical protein OSB04_016304 [Centaurea solstitialis]|uniref:Uncharacterized protein n=1 Tax=Centaurea solstitialis TaxID=347529 RepID=A0AA38WJK4_9ASTR|nr:hypothetical protein OSB04_016304 [Centaurea solstitialis]
MEMANENENWKTTKSSFLIQALRFSTSLNRRIILSSHAVMNLMFNLRSQWFNFRVLDNMPLVVLGMRLAKDFHVLYQHRYLVARKDFIGCKRAEPSSSSIRLELGSFKCIKFELELGSFRALCVKLELELVKNQESSGSARARLGLVDLFNMLLVAEDDMSNLLFEKEILHL